jgi:glutathione S-transferase
MHSMNSRSKEPAVPIRLYDLTGANDARFSPYCTRVKMALALKGLAYVTEPVPFTAISAIAGGGFKTLPLIEDGARLVSDSFTIAEYLDETYPGAPLFAPDSAGKAAARFVEGAMFSVLHMPAMPLVAKSIHDCLMPADQSYFRASREARLGRTLEEAAIGNAERLPEYRKLFHPLRHTLGTSAYFGGDTPLYVDAIVFGSLFWLHAVSDLDWLAGEDALAAWYGRCFDLTFR